MTALKWSQVHTWRLAQHGLTRRFPLPEIVGAVERTGGIQAQVMSAAELALCARVEGLSPGAVQAALFQDHALVKTWAMRGTLHIVSSQELPLYVAAQDWQPHARWVRYFAESGISGTQMEDFFAAIPHVLEQGALTRPQLAEAVAQHMGAAHVRDFILAESWGTPLKPSAYRGELCFGPGQGKTATFMNPRAWVHNWSPIKPELALQTIARRYLQTFGPATSDHFAFWWGCTRTSAKKLFQALAAELEEVEIEGWRALALRATLPHIQSVEPAEQILLLPLFDAYTIGVPRDCAALLAPAYKRQVFNLQGWTFAVVLVNGSIQGLWSSQTQRSQAVIKINLFSPATPAIRKGIEAEAERLGQLFEKAVTVEYAA